MNLITLKTYPSRIEAEVAKTLLEANGITCLITVDDLGGMRPAYVYLAGAKLQIREKDLEAARLLLDGSDS